MVERRLEKNKELNEILTHIKEGHNFLLNGGAGSGKTYSLVEVLQNISSLYPSVEIACITYTNVAAIEIKNRASIKNLRVSTIHDFLWDMICKFQKEMKSTLLELINDDNSKINNPTPNAVYTNDFKNGIQYKEYVRIDCGEISHEEVLILANKMYYKYPRLCDLLIDKYPFIFVDEYQDTSPLVVEILLDFLQKRKKKNIIGFFGDTMQSIYDEGVGDIDSYIAQNIVYKVEKEQNRRNSQTIINLANEIRTDGLIQSPSKDITAPNMENGIVKQGTVKFLYSDNFDLKRVKTSQYTENWDFENAEDTKDLRLTHNLIADEAGFSKLMKIYDKDPIFKFKEDFKKEAKKREFIISEDDAFDSVVRSMKWVYTRGENTKNKTHLQVLLENEETKALYNYVKEWPYHKVKKIYLNKDNLIDDRVVADGITVRAPKRDRLIQHLFNIQDIVSFYDSKNYHEVIRKTSFTIYSIDDKRYLKNCIDELKNKMTESIESVIEYANQTKLCIMDDKFNSFIENNEYLYWRVKNLPYSEFKNLYLYIKGYMPFSTQHKIKGLEFKNVLLVLYNRGWDKYNFEYLLNPDIESNLTYSKKKSFPSILNRTKKLFYVCCTRAKENLIVYYPSPSIDVIEGAKKLFGEKNCINLDS